MLRVKPSASIDVVCMSDPALHEVKIERMRLYESSRDIADLGDLSKLAEQPTVWECDSLDARFENFLDGPSSDDLWFVFRHNARPKGELLDENGRQVTIPMEEVNGKKVLSDDVRAMVGRDAVREIASVMIQRCNGRNGVDSPFYAIAPGQWSDERIQYRTHLARQEALSRLSARGNETVSDTPSESDKVTVETSTKA